jgi:hypothetical protein
MKPKDKAKELVDKYYNFGDQEFDYSKEFALIAVDELLNNFLSNRTTNYGKERYYFWQAVKQEIEKL